MKPGPPIQRLTHRLSECPPEFLAEPRIGERGKVRVNAVVADLMVELGAPLWGDDVFEAFRLCVPTQRNWLRVVLVAAWLLHDSWFRTQQNLNDADFAARALRWLLDDLAEFADLVAAEACIEDTDRREELARRCQVALSLTPSGESVKQAQNRLATLDTVAQRRVLNDTQARQKRADALRKKMEEKRAYEAAGRWTRE